MQEIRDDIQIIVTRSTWLLGILVVIILAFASFLIQSPSEEIRQFSLVWWGKAIAGTFFIYYLIIASIYMRPLLPSFKAPARKPNKTELQEELNRLTKDFTALASLFIIPLPFIFIFGVSLVVSILQ